MAGAGRWGSFGGAGAGGDVPGLGADLGRTSPALTGPSWKGRAFAALLLLGGLALMCIGFYNVAHTAGLAGRHGTFTAMSCWVEQGSRNSGDRTVCSGTFLPENGTRTVSGAVLERKLREGQKIEVQQTGYGYLASGVGETSRWGFLFFMGWLIAALGVPFAVTGLTPDKDLMFEVEDRVRGTRTGLTTKYLLIGGAGGLAVCGYLTWVL